MKMRILVGLMPVLLSFFGRSAFSQDFLAQKYLKLKLLLEGDSVKILYTNTAPAAFLIHFSTFKSQNVNTSSAQNKNFLARVSDKQILLISFPILDKHKASNIQYQYTPNYGYLIPGAVEPARDVIYSLPYSKKENYLIGQGYLGKFSHQNLYALDFELPEHTEVHAARGGEVVEVVNDFNESGLSQEFEYKANSVSILHSDGSIASYSHFQYHGIKVTNGEFIKEGEFIGFSGHTGMASGPHLHFCVSIPSATGLQSIATPFWFDKTGHSGLLEEHKSYTSM